MATKKPKPPSPPPIDPNIQVLLDRTEQILSNQVMFQIIFSHDICEILGLLRKNLLCCEKNTAILKKIFDLVSPSSLTVTFTNEQGDFMGNTATIVVGQTANATAHEWSGLNGTGVELPLAGAVSWVSSDPAIATVDPTSGLITAVAPGQATITATDAANGLTGSGVVSDTPVVAQSLTVDIAPN